MKWRNLSISVSAPEARRGLACILKESLMALEASWVAFAKLKQVLILL